MSDNTSLDQLHDIVAPAAAPLWPLAPGWQILLALAALLLVIAGLRAFSHYQRNRYRQEALAELEQTLKTGKPANDPARLAAIAALLKRTALTAFPRQQVAAATGHHWFTLLDQTGGTRFGDGLGRALEQANYSGSNQWTEAQLQQLAEAARHWIKHHKTAVPGTEPPP